MSLKEALDKIKAGAATRIPPEIQAVMKQALDELRASGIAARALKLGDHAPAFQLPNQDGVIVASSGLLAKGPLAISFYRGKW
jgi:hypothetical protein